MTQIDSQNFMAAISAAQRRFREWPKTLTDEREDASVFESQKANALRNAEEIIFGEDGKGGVAKILRQERECGTFLNTIERAEQTIMHGPARHEDEMTRVFARNFLVFFKDEMFKREPQLGEEWERRCLGR